MIDPRGYQFQLRFFLKGYAEVHLWGYVTPELSFAGPLKTTTEKTGLAPVHRSFDLRRSIILQTGCKGLGYMTGDSLQQSDT